MNTILILIIAAIAPMILGFLWYGPIFGKLFMRLCGVTQKQVEAMKKDPKFMRQMNLTYFTSYVLNIVCASVIYVAVSSFGADAATGATIGFLGWLGFGVVSLWNSYLYQGKPHQQYLLDGVYYLVSFVILGAIVGALA
jgi:hypothetical protein